MARFIVILLMLYPQMNSVWGQYYQLDSLSLKTIENKKFNWRQCQHKLKVVAFLAIDCPLSQQSTLTLREIQDKLSDKVSVIGVFPGKEPKAAYVEFRKKYRISFPLLQDKDYKLSKLLGATITPEVFLFDTGDDRLYYGAIDDRAISLSKRKNRTEKNYLKDAIQDHISGKRVGVPHINAVGCYIEINQN